MAADSGRAAYALRLNVDYPEQLDRLRTAFRIIWLIPVLIVPAVVVGGGILIGGPLLMVLFRQKYPRWWFDWNVEMTRFSARIGASLALLTDDYPSTDEQQAVHLDIDYPDVERDLNRWLPLVKWLLAIPHYVVLFFLLIAEIVVVVIAWFAVVVTGRYPRDLFDFVVGVGRWQNRVIAYALLMVTDEYPPFRLGE
jgi:hypothetical protein